jgi:hypothetical protein
MTKFYLPDYIYFVFTKSQDQTAEELDGLLEKLNKDLRVGN